MQKENYTHPNPSSTSLACEDIIPVKNSILKTLSQLLQNNSSSAGLDAFCYSTQRYACSTAMWGGEKQHKTLLCKGFSLLGLHASLSQLKIPRVPLLSPCTQPLVHPSGLSTWGGDQTLEGLETRVRGPVA